MKMKFKEIRIRELDKHISKNKKYMNDICNAFYSYHKKTKKEKENMLLRFGETANAIEKGFITNENLISEFISSAVLASMKSKRPMLHIYITQKMETFLISAFSKMPELSGSKHFFELFEFAKSEVKGNDFSLIKFSLEEGSKNESFVLGKIEVPSDGNPSAFGSYGLWDDEDIKWKQFMSCLGYFLKEIGNELEEINPQEIKYYKRNKGKRVILRGNSEVMEDIENSKSPHFRRGHYRLLSSDRYKKRGIVFVKGCFVKGKARQIHEDCVEV